MVNLKVSKIVPEKEEWKTIRVKKSTYSELIRSKGIYELMSGEDHSMNDTIKNLLESCPKIDVALLAGEMEKKT